MATFLILGGGCGRGQGWGVGVLLVSVRPPPSKSGGWGGIQNKFGWQKHFPLFSLLFGWYEQVEC